MSNTIFIKETDNRGRIDIIEGTPKPGKVFSIKRFVCQITPQETEEETQALADHVIESLTKNPR